VKYKILRLDPKKISFLLSRANTAQTTVLSVFLTEKWLSDFMGSIIDLIQARPISQSGWSLVPFAMPHHGKLLETVPVVIFNPSRVPRLHQSDTKFILWVLSSESFIDTMYFLCPSYALERISQKNDHCRMLMQKYG